MISTVSGVVQRIPEVSSTSHRISRFANPIADTEIPKHFQNPSMKLYDGITDPEEHIRKNEDHPHSYASLGGMPMQGFWFNPHRIRHKIKAKCYSLLDYVLCTSTSII